MKRNHKTRNVYFKGEDCQVHAHEQQTFWKSVSEGFLAEKVCDPCWSCWWYVETEIRCGVTSQRGVDEQIA